MKKIAIKSFMALAVTAMLSLTNVSFASDLGLTKGGGGDGRFSVGVEGASPMGDFSDAVSTGFGLSLRYEMPMSGNLALTGTAGYLVFSGKESNSADWGMIPVQVGAKYYFQEQQKGFYAQVMLGIHASSVKTPEYTLYGVTVPSATASETDFSYAPELGYHLANIDLGLRYQLIATTGSTTSYLGLRAAYVFGGK